MRLSQQRAKASGQATPYMAAGDTDPSAGPSPADTPAVIVDSTARTATVTGLTNGTAYTFTVTATNPDGTSPPSAPSAPVTPIPAVATTLTLAAPTSVLHGGTVQLTGRLQQANTAEGIAGESVTVERRPRGTTTWTTLTTLTTASDGTLDPAPQVTPQAHTGTGWATRRHRSMPPAPARPSRFWSACA